MMLQEIIDSQVPATAKIAPVCTLINAVLGEHTMMGKVSKLAYSKMDDYSYVGDSTIVINTNIGKFTSISWGVTIGPEEHDYRRVTNHSFLYSVKAFQLVDRKYYSPFEKECVIGSDVWIGCNSTILRGVKVGHGAVIGANSLVNRDVPPYAVVVGSPARVVRFRFDKEIIAQLLELEWWNLPFSVISEHAALFAETPDRNVLEQLQKIKNGL